MPSTSDIQLHFKLTFFDRSFIRMVSKRGGETSFDFGKVDEQLRRTCRERVELMVRSGIFTMTPLIGTGGFLLRLTDVGTKLADQVNRVAENV